jgi:hypothetical protein
LKVNKLISEKSGVVDLSRKLRSEREENLTDYLHNSRNQKQKIQHFK